MLVLLFLLFTLAISSTALAAPEKPVADFNSPDVDSYSSKDEITFFDNSTGSPTSWFWDFGDGITSTEQNPTHVYSAMGGYTVNLTVVNNMGSNATSKYGYVLVSGGSGFVHPASFSSDVTSGSAPLTVVFKDDGYAGIWKSWSFGDGSNENSGPYDDSELITEYTTHTYEKPGKYTVMLWYDDRGGNGIITKYHYINVTVPVKPVASFTMDKLSGPKLLTIAFTDKSTGNPNSWFWNFGDGANSTDQNPTHTYSAAGTYTVNLTVSNGNGSESKLATINVLKAAKPCAYITNYASNSVSIIDTATNNITATVNVGNGPIGVAVNPAGTKVYVANFKSGSVSVIDTDINSVTATVPVGTNPYGVAVNPAGTMVYVTDFVLNTLFVINTATNNVTAKVNVGAGYSSGVAVSPDGTKVYEANGNTLSVIDTATNNVTATVPVEDWPKGIAVSPDGKKVYVTNEGRSNNNNISVIDTATNTVTATVPAGNGPWGIAVSPGGTKIYAANHYSNNVSVIDTATNTVTATVPVGSDPSGIAVSPDGTKAYVANWGSGTVSVIDTRTNKVTDVVNAGINPFAFGQFTGALQALEPVLLVANFSSNVTNGSAPLSVQFNDSSENATEWFWNFGDGIYSTKQNPAHIYSSAGAYTVNLTVSNGYKIASKSVIVTVLQETDSSGPITVPETELPVVNFNSNVTSGYAPFSVQFNDSSENATEWFWNFGDGIYSTEQNPAHTYSSAGAYTVNLTVSNGYKIASKSVIVTVLQVTDSSDESRGSSSSGSSSRGSGHSDIGALSIISTEGSNHTVNISTDRMNANGTEIKPEDNNHGVEQNNRTTTASVEQTPEQTQSSNTPGKGGTKTPDFEMIGGIVSLFAVVLYKVSKKGN
jgi:YVTN family beta-propeller protein